MKSSAWYQKLWERKLNELPHTGEDDKAWLEMKVLLDEQMPTDASNVEPSKRITTTKSVAAKVGTWLSYILPAAAMIYGATFLYDIENFNRPGTKPSKIKKVQIIKVDSANVLIDSLSVENALQTMEASASNIIPSPTSAYDATDATSIQSKDENNFQGSNLLQVNVRRTNSLSESTNLYRSIQTESRILQQSHVPVNSIPRYSYGISVGTNIHKNQTFYVGGFATIKVSDRMTASAALLVHTPRSFKGTYNRPSYFRPDSNPSFNFTDSRKLAVLEAPLTLDYHITGYLKISAGPVLILPIKQSEIKLGPIQLARDTLFNGNNVINIIRNTKPRSINYGFRTGVGIKMKRLETTLHYQIVNPYEFKNTLGTNKSTYNTIQVGISYNFGKR
jgi:hypothetical protein